MQIKQKYMYMFVRYVYCEHVHVLICYRCKRNTEPSEDRRKYQKGNQEYRIKAGMDKKQSAKSKGTRDKLNATRYLVLNNNHRGYQL